MNDNAYLLTVNAGSSSIKLALFTAGDNPIKSLEGVVENIGQPTAVLINYDQTNPEGVSRSVEAKDYQTAAGIIIDWLKSRLLNIELSAIGHRIVHGGPKYYASSIITDSVLTDLQELIAFDPEHLPTELWLIEEFKRQFPEATQVACFDTAFHHDLPIRAQMLPIPRQLGTEGIKRYGFHGLSYMYILEELHRVEGELAANGKVIIAHLGSGVSLAALRRGKSIDTTMGLTPAGGVMMSTRSGDLDPGLNLFLVHSKGYDAEKFSDMVNFKSGLLGVSETTADMKTLLEIEDNDTRAKDAVDLFCYQIKKSIGSLSAALGGLNTLVFTGGMGENAPKIRTKVCEGLEFLGIKIEAVRNQESARLISSDDSRVGVHVIHTEEAAIIARETVHCIQNGQMRSDYGQ